MTHAKLLRRKNAKRRRNSKGKHKSAFPKGLIKGENGAQEAEGEDSGDTESEKSVESKSEEKVEIKEKQPVSSKRVQSPAKEVKINKESRSEKRKARTTNRNPKAQKKEESDEGSPERRLDSTPKRKTHNFKKEKIATQQRQSTAKKQPEKQNEKSQSSTLRSKSKNVQFHKLNWGNVSRKIDCWKNIPVPPQQETAEREEEDEEIEAEILEETPERIKQSNRKPQRPIAVKNVSLTQNQIPDEDDEMRLVESLSKQGDEIEIVEMNEDRVPYKKVLVKKGEQDQYDIEVFEEGEGEAVQQDEFTDDYDSAELSVPEEREADEYVYSEQKPQQEFEVSSGSAHHDYPKEESEYSSIQPLSIEELENLYQEVHGSGHNNIQICSEPNFTSIIPQITKNSIFLN